ncbi:nicotinate-nucleotide adenylyltransferase [Roseateles sp. YR242]|uniref:nicotinate (nicotinamide) nucleotide adenylyltransferase n=1 Tax=Roseateles sp. YR242 TaxID=1855305 RepID=UPI0008CF5646|nr:nicotinate (nicotinamide) nucleotide adenylyltransferase [Roseateles sp. YR242]SEK33517.1 nicotinate-nucleotide adenylyltransferase [Roseateles sp. YR242]
MVLSINGQRGGQPGGQPGDLAGALTGGPHPARQVGWFGGSFDPVHRAHRVLAQAALDQLGLDEVRWVVAGQPWQKAGRPLAPAVHRAAMVQLMIEGEARFVLDDSELRRGGPSYTLDSVTAWQEQHPGDQLWLILGQDQLAGLPTWKGWEDLIGRVGLAVAARASDEVRAPAALLERPHRLARLLMPALEWSSTEVRRKAAEGGDVRPMVGEKVAGYIDLHRLYSEH